MILHVHFEPRRTLPGSLTLALPWMTFYAVHRDVTSDHGWESVVDHHSETTTLLQRCFIKQPRHFLSHI